MSRVAQADGLNPRRTQPWLANTTLESWEDRIHREEIQYGAVVAVGLYWGLTAILMRTPLADDMLGKSVLLAPPLLISLLLVLTKPVTGFALWTVILGVLVTQTGYQLDLGTIRTSALEVVIVCLLLILFWMQRKLPSMRRTAVQFPARRAFLIFVAYALSMFLIGMIRGDDFASALTPMKGFLLYPLMALIMVRGIPNMKMLWIAVIPLAVWFTYAAGQGLVDFARAQSASPTDELARVAVGSAPINLYGIAISSVSMLVLGVGMSLGNKRYRMLGLVLAAWLFIGSAVTVSRAVWVGYALGVLLILFGRRTRIRRRYLVLLAVLVVAIFFLLPEQASHRLLQTTDTSTLDREFFLTSGFHAWEANWLIGTGWGNAFWYFPGTGLVPTGQVPWYHNDYLNLAVQLGTVGLLLYLAFWWQVMRRAKLGGSGSESAQAAFGGFVQGCRGALIVLLAGAAFEHVLWRTDSAGVVGWTFGLFAASINLRQQAAEAADDSVTDDQHGALWMVRKHDEAPESRMRTLTNEDRRRALGASAKQGGEQAGPRHATERWR